MDAAADRAKQRDLVRRGYDAISTAYRSDDSGSSTASAESTAQYAGWVGELAGQLRPPATVLDLGCGAGVPGTRLLSDHGYRVFGADISAIQVGRASRLVPKAQFFQADIATLQLASGSVDAVVSLYALIHLPLADQQDLFPRIRIWLRDGGYFLGIVGASRWTGVEDYLGAPMFWDHADTATYLQWLEAAQLRPVWSRFVPEGTSGHTLVLAQAAHKR
jgi:cyclopropane fatty-acyl-phospholipid synthase-like methyltransferase